MQDRTSISYPQYPGRAARQQRADLCALTGDRRLGPKGLFTSPSWRALPQLASPR